MRLPQASAWTWDDGLCGSASVRGSPSGGSSGNVGDSPRRGCASVCAAAEGSSWLRRLTQTPTRAWTPHSYSAPRPATPLVPTRTLDCLTDGGRYPAGLLPKQRLRQDSMLRRPSSAPACRRSSARTASSLQTPAAADSPAAPLQQGRIRTSRRYSRSLRRSDGTVAVAAADAVRVRRADEDECSAQEREIVAALSAARADPAAFADDVARHYLIGAPYLSRPLRVAEAEALRDSLSDRLRAAEAAIAGAVETDRKAQQSMRAAWEQEDLEREQARKGRKKAPAPKKGSAAAAQLAEEEAEEEARRQDERQQATASLTKQQRAKAEERARLRDDLTEKLALCSAGCELVRGALRSIASAAPMPPLQYSRGLSLAARDRGDVVAASDDPPDRTEAAIEVPFHTTDYGLRIGGSFESVVLGSSGPMASVYDLAIDAALPGRDNRNALLHGKYGSAGCCWLQHRTRGACCVVMYAEGWQDCSHICRRPHLSLQQLRHTLHTHPDPLSYSILFVGGSGVEPESPAEHPIVCGNIAMMKFKVPEGVGLSVGFASPGERDELQSTLTQHSAEAGVIEVFARVPGLGVHTLSVHARAVGSSSFSYIGPVQLRCVDWPSNERHLSFPETCGSFLRRRLRLASPLYSPLRAGDKVDFDVVAPAVAFNDAELAALSRRIAAKEAELAGVAAALSSTRAESDSSAGVVAARLEELARMREGDGDAAKGSTPSSTGAKRKKDKAAEAEAEEQLRRRLADIAAEEQHLLAETEERRKRENALERRSRQLSSQLRVLHTERSHLTHEHTGSAKVEVLNAGRRMPLAAMQSGGRHVGKGLRLQGGQAGLLVDGQCVATWVVTP